MWPLVKTPHLTTLALETRYELMKLVRLPVFAFMTLGFPVVFYLMFGVALGGRAAGGRNVALPMLGTYGAFGVIGAALFSFGVGVAVERAQGWLLLKRATPMPPLVYVLGKVGASMVFCGIIVVLLELCGTLLAGVRLPPAQWASLTGALIAGSIPFCALGLAVGFAAGPNAAPGFVNLLHLPGAFAGGLWMPIEMLPERMQSFAPWLPQYHLGQLALSIIGQARDPHPMRNALCLAAWTVVAIALAVLSFRRDEGKLYG
jgi:ABC-2 type transport system permease protein